MTTILDSLAVELGLDPAKFIEGMKKTLEASKKGQDQVIKHAQSIEDHTKKAADSINKLSREFQSFFAVIGGAFGVAAIKSFVDNITTAEAAVGRMAANLGTTPQALTAWGYAVQRVGGNAQAGMASIAGLRERVFNFTNFGEDPGKKFWTGLSRGGVRNDFLSTKDPIEQIYQIGKAIQNINRTEGRASAYQFGKSAFGLDEGSINLIIEAGAKLRQTIKDISNTVTPRDKDIAAAKELQDAWFKLTQTMTKLGTLLVTEFEPVMKRVLDFMTKVLGNATATTPAGMQQDLNQTLEDAAKNGPRFVPKGSQIPDPNQGFWGRNFGHTRYITDPNFKGESNETGSSAATPESSAATGGGSAYLAKTRASYFAELDRDPALRRDVIKAASMEGGLQSNIEQMVNMSQMRGYTSLRQALNSGFYGPVNRGGLRFGMSQGTRAKGEEAIAAVRGGSNIIDYRTDQGMWSDPNGGWYRNHPGLARYKKVEGANFFDFRGGGSQWAAEQKEKERQYNATPYSTPGVGLDWSLYGSSFAPRTSENSRNGSISTNSSQMYLNGPISIQTQATNADGFARDLRPAIEAQTNTFLANGAAQ